jgi:hypothetical protein
MVTQQTLLRVLAAADETDPEDIEIRAALVAVLAIGDEDCAADTTRDMSSIDDNPYQGRVRRAS